MYEYAASFETSISRIWTQNPENQPTINTLINSKSNKHLIDLYMWQIWVISLPFSRYWRSKGCGILVHAQLSFWGPGRQLLENVLLFEVVSYIAYIGPAATSKLGAAVSGCRRRVRILRIMSFCKNVYQLLCPAASGGSES